MPKGVCGVKTRLPIDGYEPGVTLFKGGCDGGFFQVEAFHAAVFYRFRLKPSLHVRSRLFSTGKVREQCLFRRLHRLWLRAWFRSLLRREGAPFFRKFGWWSISAAATYDECRSGHDSRAIRSGTAGGPRGSRRAPETSRSLSRNGLNGSAPIKSISGNRKRNGSAGSRRKTTAKTKRREKC